MSFAALRETLTRARDCRLNHIPVDLARGCCRAIAASLRCTREARAALPARELKEAGGVIVQSAGTLAIYGGIGSPGTALPITFPTSPVPVEGSDWIAVAYVGCGVHSTASSTTSVFGSTTTPYKAAICGMSGASLITVLVSSSDTCELGAAGVTLP